MAYGKDNIVLLRINTTVASFAETIFTNINAAAQSGLEYGKTYEDLQKVNFKAVNHRNPGKGNDFFRQHQAEVMVFETVPKEYIIFP